MKKVHNKQMAECMLDIETTSTKPNAKILTIGAVRFLRSGTILTNTFYVRINVNSMNSEFDTDEKTMKWWSEQSETSYNEAFQMEPRFDIKTALEKFITWYKQGCRLVWGNSPSFDCIIMENAFRQCKLQCPWNFWETRDFRTLMDVTMTRLKSSNNHMAVDDAMNQTKALIKAFAKFEK